MSSKEVDTAETSDASNIPILEKNQCLVADEDVEDIVESSTAGPTDDIDEMGPPEKKIPPTAGTLDVDEMDPSKNKIPATAGTLLDIDEMDPSEIKIPATAGTLLDID